MKKMFYVLLAFVLTISLSMSAFAAPADNRKGNTFGLEKVNNASWSRFEVAFSGVNGSGVATVTPLNDDFTYEVVGNGSLSNDDIATIQVINLDGKVIKELEVVVSGLQVGPQTTYFWNQQFDSNTDGWIDGEGYGIVTWQEAGTMKVEGTDSGAFSRFDGYRSTWPGEWFAEIDVYLDPTAWNAGEGFDYSVAANGTDGNHQRDYIFHVTKDTSSNKFLIGGSNNSNFAPREDLDTLGNHYEVTTSGWYTLQHRFYDMGGYLAVDLNVISAEGNILFTETRANAADTIPGEVGGNRYAWFTHVTVDGGILVDNHQLYVME